MALKNILDYVPRFLNDDIDEDEVCPIGTIDEFTFNSVQHNVHSLAIACLSQSILNTVNSKNKKYLAPNKFACGTVYTKEVDFTIYYRKETPIIGEVSFRHETLKNLIIESLLYLTEYVDCNYVIGMKIYERNTFQADLFVLERDESNKVDNSKIEELKFQIEKQIKENKFGATSKKISKDFDPDLCEKKNRVLDDFLNDDLLKYGVKIRDKIRISEEHLGRETKFSLQSKLVNLDLENQEIQVAIESNDLMEIFNHWKEYKRLKIFKPAGLKHTKIKLIILK
ncbi:hypothetical protein BpHYR1_022279 [Brachionus plicatilis]|uniref:Uncharacterized protein n=1 Tax=Brachionus plicatilis TaxID=10195 RepID=A0A3M7QXP0_BRAPC|nr:hypothetical protein BpHYR1_022279 [Brachionus plicatilis]